ncbi:MAG: hypothetical protein ACI4XE_11150 [Acutalibacteraceae bacterium]
MGSFEPNAFPDEIDLARHYFSYLIQNSDIPELLIINRQDSLYACHMKNAQILEDHFGELPYFEKSHARYFMAVRTGITISMLTAWLQAEEKKIPTKLQTFLKSSSYF